MAETKKKSTAKATDTTISSATAEAPQTATAPAQPNPDTGMNIQDLITVAQLIQLGSQRGAWRAEELTTVGTLYTKLIAFLKSVGAISEPQATQANAQETK